MIANFITFLSLLLFYFFWRLDLNRTSFYFTPIKLFITVSFIYLILPSIIIPNYFQEGIFWSLNTEILILKHISIFLFNFTFLISFIFFQKIYFLKINFNFKKNSIFIAIVFLLLALISKIIMFRMGMFFIEAEGMNNSVNLPRFFKLINNLHLWGFMIMAIIFFKVKYDKSFFNKRFINYLFYLYFIFTISIPFLQGRRFGVLFPLIILFSIYIYHKNIPFKKTISYGLLIGIFFLIMTVFRQAQVYALSNNSSVNIYDIFNAISFLDNQYLIQSFLSRLFNVYINLNRVIEYSLNYTYVPFYNPFQLAFTGLIPAFLWSNKPNLSIGNEMGKELNLININNDIIGINIGWIGEGFYYLGIPGVILASLLFSFSIAFFYKLVNLSFDSGKIVLFMYVIFLVSGFQMELAFTFNSFFKGSFILLFILYIFSKTKSIRFI